MSRKADRKDLKNPDQFVTFWSRVGSQIAARKQAVLAGVLTVLAVVVVGWGAKAFLESRQIKAADDFARIERIGGAELIPVTGEAKFGDGLPHFKTDKERYEAALKACDEFLGAHGGSRLKDEALLLKARYLLVLEKPGDAANTYQQILGADLDHRLRFIAAEGLAYAHEANGQVDKAIASFGALADDAQKAGGFYRDRALFNKARLLENKGDKKEAEKIFREILDKTPMTPMRDDINDRLASLEGK